MKTKNFQHAAIALLFAVCFSSCSKKGGDEQFTIVGEWKIVTVEIPFIGESNDYSLYSIVYEFRTNGILTVSGETDHIELYRGHEPGEYPYAIISKDEAREKVGIDDYRLKIGAIYLSYNVSSKVLVIDGKALDGGTYHFVKIGN